MMASEASQRVESKDPTRMMLFEPQQGILTMHCM
jgi:hypothetical protein